ncbi:MAG: DUF2723 domain-containing protein, partial [Bacteroidota bacterium]
MRRCGDHCVALLLSAASLLLYSTTLATTIGWTDTGELMAVAATLGIGHPTGYPLLSILGRAWLHLPLGLRIAVQLNVLSALLTALAVGFFYLFVRSLLTGSEQPERNNARWPAVAAAGFFGTSVTVWSQSSSYEVYALHLLLVVTMLFAWSRAIDEQDKVPAITSRWWFLFALLVGFGFANHMTTVLLAPALFWHYFMRYGISKGAWRRLLRMAPPALAGLSVYAFLPIRAASRPPLNWGDPFSWEALLRHVAGAQYQVWMFNGPEVMGRQLRSFVGGLPSEFVLPVFAVAVWGLFVLMRGSRTIGMVLLLLGAATVVYAVNYDIHEIGPYFLTAYLVVAVAIDPGLRDLQGKTWRGGRWYRAVLPVLAAAGVVWQVVVNAHEVRSAVPDLVERFARSVLEHVPRNAVVITGRWDYLYSPALYLQQVEHVRPDVLLIDHSLLRDRTWYVDALRARAPWLNDALLAEFESFIVELQKFERREPFTLSVIQVRWEGLWRGILSVSSRSRTVFVDHRLAGEVKGWDLRPDGYLLRLTTPDDSTV